MVGVRCNLVSEEELGIGRLKMSHNMVVADIKDECILGTDFLTPHGCVVDLKDSVLTIRENKFLSRSLDR